MSVAKARSIKSRPPDLRLARRTVESEIGRDPQRDSHRASDQDSLTDEHPASNSYLYSHSNKYAHATAEPLSDFLSAAPGVIDRPVKRFQFLVGGVQ